MGFAERTFIVLDKRFVVGEFVHGDPHVEGLGNFYFYFLCFVLDFNAAV